MKKGIHPESYRLVAFKDMSNEQVFITRSCVNSKETIEIGGYSRQGRQVLSALQKEIAA